MPRAVPALAAIVVCAWFVLGIRQAHEVDAATAIVGSSSRLTAAQARHADALLHSAGLLNPDRQVDILRAQVAAARGEKAEAQRILRSVVTSEPDNLNAWYEVVQAAPGVRTFQDGLRHIKALDPRIS